MGVAEWMVSHSVCLVSGVIWKVNIVRETRSFVEENVGIILIVSLGYPGLHLRIIEQVPDL